MSQNDKTLRIGVDLDGVLADFNSGFQKLVVKVTGEDRFKGDDFKVIDPPTWHYTDRHYGYTKEQNRQCWDAVIADPTFWANLNPYPLAGDYVKEFAFARVAGHEVYFITTRVGVSCQLQSQYWLQAHGFPGAAVLIAATHESKGLLAKGLKLTHFVDDKPENCEAIKTYAPDCSVSLLSRRYNEYWHGHAEERKITVINSVSKFLEELQNDARNA